MRGMYERPMSDIVPRKRAERKTADTPVTLAPKKAAPSDPHASSRSRIDEGMPLEEEELRERPRVRRPRRALKAVAVVTVIIVAAGAGAWTLLPQATIVLTLKKVSVTFAETIIVAIEPAPGAPGSPVIVPGELLEARANLSLPFSAAATEAVAARATGKLTVWNAYRSASQALVLGTRFESPDKKIFRIDRSVVVPGAKVENGKIVPSSIEVTVVADEAGETFNLPPSSGWRIPGFAGSPRYEGFYAEAKEGMKGGFTGERAKPSAAELTAARAQLAEALDRALESQFLILLSDRFKALPGSRRFTLLSENITPDADDAHIFHLFGEAAMQQIVFEEPTLREALVEKAKRTLPGDLAVRDFSFTLGTTTVDFGKGRMTFTAQGKGVFTEPFDADAFRTGILGAREEALKATVFALPGVEAATVSLSPFFVYSVPENPKKVHVMVQ